ncbi:MAG: RDD family protein [Chitinophagales bacterium]
MRSIDILTSQNVTISYELASLQDRIFAFFIDLVVLNILAWILFEVVVAFTGSFGYYLVYIPVTLFYSLFSEIIFDGRSVGKMAVGLKVVKIDGILPSLNDYFIRWAFRAIDIMGSLGAVACMTISSSPKGQRLGDVIANTTVIKTSPRQKILLNDLLNIRSLENYEPQYPAVKQFSEQDMLLLKEVMDRYSQNNNDAHFEALNDALEIVKERLELDRIPHDKIGFIRILIKDYVAMSR